MSKKRTVKPRPKPTRRQLASWQRQKHQQQIIIAAGVFIIVVVLAMIGFGWYTNDYRPLHQTVLSVNGVKFNMDYFLKTLGFYIQNQSNVSLDRIDQVLKVVERNELIRQHASKLNITVSEKEVDKELSARKLPDTLAYRTLLRMELLSNKLNEEYFGKEIPVTAPQRQVMAMFLESRSQANEVKAKLDGGEDFGKLAAEVSLDNHTKSVKGDLDWIPRGMSNELLTSSVAEDKILTAPVGLLADPLFDEGKTKAVGYWLVEVLETKHEPSSQMHLRVMLLGSPEQAEEVRAKLSSGEDFGALAKTYSQDEKSRDAGGDFGWLEMNNIPVAFARLAGVTEPGMLKELIRDDKVSTKGGYWLFKVLAEDANKEISPENKDRLKAIAGQKWLAAVLDDPSNKVEGLMTDDMKTWAMKRILGVKF